MKGLRYRFSLFIVSLSLAACGTSKSSSTRGGSSNPFEPSSSSIDDEITLSEAIANTKENYTTDETQHSVDALSSTSTYTKRVRNVDLPGGKVFYKYSALSTSSIDELDEYILNEESWTYYCYFQDDEGIKRRYKNAANDFVWKEDSKTHDDYFDDLFFNKVDVDLFEQVNEAEYAVKNDYLSSEQLAKLTSFYGSYSYLNQDYSYFKIGVADGHVDSISYQIHFTPREGSSIKEYDTTVMVDVSFSAIGSTAFEIPALPVYAEDLLEADENLLAAQENTETNYTYHEEYKVIDEEGNVSNRVFDEMIDGENSYTNQYVESIDNYMESYEYFIDKESFSGGVSHRLQEVTLTHSETGVTYSTYDVGVVDESYNRVQNLGGSYGVKIFAYDEDERCFSPVDGAPENNNKEGKTYLYIAASHFVHGFIGNYTSNAGVTYHYEINDFRIYIANKTISKVSYDFTLSLTENDVTKSYNYIGDGVFSDVGTSAIVIPTDPNDEIELDSRLESLYETLGADSYSYEETFSLEDSSGEALPFYTDGQTSIYDGKYYEYVEGDALKRTLYGLYYSNDDESQIEYGLIDDYYYFGAFNLYNYYEILDGSDRTYSVNYSGSYSFDSYIAVLQSYLKYFSYVRTTTKGTEIFSLKDDYLSHYGNALILSASDNVSLDFAESMQLSIKSDGAISLSYDYKTYDSDTGDFVGYCLGEIKLSNISSTEVDIPGFDESCIDRTLENLLGEYVSDGNYTHSGQASVKGLGQNAKECLITIRKGAYSLDFDELENPSLFYYDNSSHMVQVNIGSEDAPTYKDVFPLLRFDLSKLDLDWLYLSGGIYWVSSDSIEAFFANVLGLSGEDYNFITVYFQIDGSENIDMYLSYQTRITNEQGKYEVFTVNCVVEISK